MSSVRERVMSRLQAQGASPKRSLGQNFLVSDSVVDRILNVARGAKPAAAIVEVGPGLGSLTDGLREMAPQFLVVELDREFASLWREAGVRVVEADALALDWETLGLPTGSLLVSNLPYQISSSLVIERSVRPCGISRMVLMFQKEVAQRLVAKPKTAEYGLLTAIAQTFWDVRTVLEAGPRDFHPAPRVASRVVEFRERTDDASAMGLDRARYLAFVKAAFSHRRKLMAKNLAGEAGAEAALRALGHDPSRVRAEELGPSEFVRLFKAATDAV